MAARAAFQALVCVLVVGLSYAVDSCSECHANATCEGSSSPYTCKCNSMFKGNGTFCEAMTCEHDGPCHKNAACTRKTDAFHCECNDGFTGTGLSCTDVNECDDGSYTCHPNASCVNNDGGYVCKCNLLFKGNGTYCEAMTCEHDNPCHANATCGMVTDSFTCACNEGYTGSGLSCAVVDNNCTGDASKCNENATCTHRGDGTHECRCNLMFQGDGISCEAATCDNGNRCHENAVCSVEGGAFVCNCAPGYYTSGFRCRDIDECTTGTHVCHSNATCTNNDGNYTCKCDLMYKGNGTHCEATTCEHDSPCHPNAICASGSDSFICTCMDGYSGSGLRCEDVDECSGNNTCHSLAKCTNTNGSYTCKCNSGYSGNGTVCEDINECAAGTHNCHSDATCTNNEGGYTCKCNLLFKGNGTYCEAMTCEHDSPCHSEAICVLNTDSFTCTCKDGYTGSGLQCGDINECAAGTHNCHSDATCTNNEGSYTCKCNLLFKGNGTYCEAMTCEHDNPCHSEAICVLNTDSFTCTCKDGYTGSGLQCVAAIGCEEANPCASDQTCEVRDNEYICCNAGNNGVCNKICLEQNVTSEGKTYSFNNSRVDEVKVSNEICDSGRSIASITCVLRDEQPTFELATLAIVECTETVQSVVEKVDWANADTDELEQGISALNILVSSPDNLTQSDVEAFLEAMNESSEALLEDGGVVTEQTLREAVHAANSVTTSFKDSLKDGSNDNETVVSNSQVLMHTLAVFAAKVNLTTDTVTITTENINAQVKTNLSREDVEYVYSSQTLNATVPREAVDKARGKKVIFLEYKGNEMFQTSKTLESVITIEFGTNESVTHLVVPVEYSSHNDSAFGSQHLPGKHQTKVSYAVCAYYVPENRTFSTSGCCLVKGNSTEPTCRCDHLTSFAILVEYKIVDDVVALSEVSTIGCVLSIVGLFLTILMHLTHEKIRAQRTAKIFLHICSMLLAMYMVFLICVPRTEKPLECTFFTALLHYLLLAAWCWITVYSYFMYSLLVKMSGTQGPGSLKTLGVIAYVIPLIAVAITILVNVGQGSFTAKHEEEKEIYCKDRGVEPEAEPSESAFPFGLYRAENMCWLTGNSLKFGFIIPAALMLLINYVFFAAIIRSLIWKRRKVNSNSQGQSYNREVTVAVSMATTLGLTWLFGYMMLISTDRTYRIVMAWLFSITNVLQGFMLFVFSVLRRADLRNNLLDPVRSHILAPMVSISRGVSSTVRSLKHGAKYRVTTKSEDGVSSSDGGNTETYRDNRESVLTCQTTVEDKPGPSLSHD